MLQLGYTVISPILICLAFCYWLTTTFGIGEWVYIPGILFGLVSGALSFYKFCKGALKAGERWKKQKDKKPKKLPTSFNDHV